MNNEIDIPLRRFKTLLVVDLEANLLGGGPRPARRQRQLPYINAA